MQSEQKDRVRPKTKTRKKRLIIILAVLVFFVVGFFLLVPAFVSSERAREIILAKINDSVDGQTSFADLSMGWLNGVKITGLSFKDNSSRTSVEVKQIFTKPHYTSILMGSLSFGQTIIDQPDIRIKVKGNKSFNPVPEPAVYTASILGASRSDGLAIKKIDLIVNDGSLEVTGTNLESSRFSQINSTLNLRGLGRKSQFAVDMKAGNGAKNSKVHLDGHIKPQKRTGWNLEGTSGEVTIEVNDLDISTLGPIFELAGVEVQAKGLVSANLQSKLKEGRIDKLEGSVIARDLDVTSDLLKGDSLRTSRLDATVKLQSSDGLIEITRLDVRSDWASIEVAGIVPTSYEALGDFLKSDSAYDLKGDIECDLAQLLSQMPNTLGVKEGMRVTSGKLSAKVETSSRAGKREILGGGNIVDLAGVVDGKQVAFSEPVTVIAEITSDKEKIRYDKLQLSSSFAKIDCSGTNEQLKYTADIDLRKTHEQLGAFVDIGALSLDGQILANGVAGSSKDKITIAGTSVCKQISLTSKDGIKASEPRTDVDYSFVIDTKKNILNIDSLKAKATLGQMSVSDAVVPLGDKADKPLKVKVLAGDVNLEKLQPFAALSGKWPTRMRLYGTADTDISIIQVNDSYRIATEDTRIRDLKLVSADKKPFEQKQVTLTGQATVNPVLKTYSLEWQLVSPQIKIKGNYGQQDKGGQTKVTGKADLDYDWEAMGEFASAVLPEGLELEGKRKDSVTFRSQYPIGKSEQFLGNLDTKAKLGFDRAGYMGLNFGETEVPVEFQKGVMRISSFTSPVNNGKLNFGGAVNFKQLPSLLKTPGPMHIVKDVQLNDEMTKKLLTYVNPIFANAFNVTGVADFDCEQLVIPLSAENKNDIVVIGTFAVRDLNLKASDLLGQIISLLDDGSASKDMTIHPTRFVLKDGYLRYDDMRMDVGRNPVHFKGVIGLDKSLDMTITLPYTATGSTLRIGGETEGKPVKLRLKGTTDNPELDMGALLEDQLKDLLEDELRKGIEGLFN
ncbi:hypothetical protein ACFL3G_03270 [Planctomycetota bacterium]